MRNYIITLIILCSFLPLTGVCEKPDKTWKHSPVEYKLEILGIFDENSNPVFLEESEVIGQIKKNFVVINNEVFDILKVELSRDKSGNMLLTYHLFNDKEQPFIIIIGRKDAKTHMILTIADISTKEYIGFILK